MTLPVRASHVCVGTSSMWGTCFPPPNTMIGYVISRCSMVWFGVCVTACVLWSWGADDLDRRLGHTGGRAFRYRALPAARLSARCHVWACTVPESLRLSPGCPISSYTYLLLP